MKRKILLIDGFLRITAKKASLSLLLPLSSLMQELQEEDCKNSAESGKFNLRGQPKLPITRLLWPKLYSHQKEDEKQMKKKLPGPKNNI